MQTRARAVAIGLGIAVAVGCFTGCNVDAPSNTGIRINVTFHESVPRSNALGLVDTLRFYVAVEDPDHPDVYLLNGAASGIVVDVTDRDLFVDPYRLLVGRGGAQSRRIRVVVVGERNGVGVAHGQLANPKHQDFQIGSIVERTIELRPPDQSFDMSWTVTGCLVSSPMRSGEYEPFTFGSPDDRDCDGWTADEDCDDHDPTVNPGQVEGPDCDGVDNDCDGTVDPLGESDVDGDGITACGGDCDDEDPDVYPDAPEICDAKDNDCDGKCDNAEGIDVDGDGYADCGEFGSYIDHESGTCSYLPTPDCDDQNPAVNPGAMEECNGRDDNCNGLCDEGLDLDGDGYNECGSADPLIGPLEGQCVPMDPAREDCDPGNPAVHPFAPERCDGADNDCDGVYASSDLSANCYEWGSADGDCRQGTSFCVEDEGEDPWGECGAVAAELRPAARCGIWPYCAQAPSPNDCMEVNLHLFEMPCHLRYNQAYNGGLCGGPGSRPIYFLPFGFSGNNECTWHILVHGATSNYQEIGLVSPDDPQQAASNVVYGCEAALVVMPNAAVTTNPGALTATISFYYDNGNGDFYALELAVSINPMTTCAPNGESLTCTVN